MSNLQDYFFNAIGKEATLALLGSQELFGEHWRAAA